MGTQSSIRPPSKKQLLYFFTGLIVLTFLIQSYIINEVKTVRSFASVLLMWVPGIVALACSHHFGSNFRDLGLVKPRKLSVIYAYAIPALCAVVTLCILLLLGIGKFKYPASGIFKIAVVQTTIGVFVSMILAFGEELGWRGFLHTHLMRARIPEPLIVTGLIWSAWHWPLILFSDYSTSSLPLFSVFLFTVTMTSFSVILGWLRDYSRSMVPCALAHAVHDSWIQTIYPAFYSPGKLDPFFGGESGFVLAILYLLIAIYLYRRHVTASNY